MVLAYFTDVSNKYFPHGHVDLRYAISAAVTDKDKEGVNFEVVFDTHKVHFRADSSTSASEWVKIIQRIIFRSHNDGDSVKICLPVENVLDIEDNGMLEWADTVKIRIVDNDESYAIDEYFFSFFGFGGQAIDVLKTVVADALKRVEGSSADGRRPGSSKSSFSATRNHSPSNRKHFFPKVHDHVKATLSPTSAQPPSHSASPSRDGSPHMRQRNFSNPHSRGVSMSSSLSRGREASSESYVQSVEDPSGISGLMESATTDDPSGSQILAGSEVFRSPTIPRSASASRAQQAEEEARQKSKGVYPASGQAHAATTGTVDDPSSSTDRSQEPHPENPLPLRQIAKMGAYPIQRAHLLANYLNQTKNRFATESMGYMEKISGMWRGGRKHYHEHPGLKMHQGLEHDEVETDDSEEANERFRNYFGLPETETLHSAYFGYLNRVLPLYGKIYLSNRLFCFRSLLPGTRTKVIIPFKDIETVILEKGFRLGYPGLVVIIRGHEELFFEFSQLYVRNECALNLMNYIDSPDEFDGSEPLDKAEQALAEAAAAERDALQEARKLNHPERDIKMPSQASGAPESSPTILFDDPKASFLNFKPTESMRITCLTVGSRGDIQPYIALCKGLLADGHKPKIATHAEFQGWIEGHGIEFAPLGGDPSELMRICIENGTFTLQFLKEANSKFRGWLDELLVLAWEAVQGSDLLIESPSAMAGIHIAEALSIPYFRAFTMPWTRTRAYPHAFIFPSHKMGGAYNWVTYVMFDNVFWRSTSAQINRWRRKTLKLPPTSLEKMQPNKVPFLYNFSPAVVAPPLDFSDWIRVTGYWFLDEGTTWTPPDDLREFIEKARRDNKRLVYVGFGSIIVADPPKLTQDVVDAVLKADVRCVLSKGWSDRHGRGDTVVELPPEIFPIKSAPHDWLFTQMDAAAHHGGSGTTGASLRAGIPTIIRPFFGDQFFFGGRVEDLGVGICLKKWGATSFARALWEATHSERMIVKARVLGETIRKVSDRLWNSHILQSCPYSFFTRDILTGCYRRTVWPQLFSAFTAI